MLNPICSHQVKHGIKIKKSVEVCRWRYVCYVYHTALRHWHSGTFFFLMCVGEGGVNTVEYGEWADWKGIEKSGLV